MHAMMLREIIGDEELVRNKRFRFDVAGQILEYGEREFILISGLKHGHYHGILHAKKRCHLAFVLGCLINDVSDFRLHHVYDLINDDSFPLLSDDDTVVVLQLYILLRFCIGRGPSSSMPPTVLNLADDLDSWNRYDLFIIC